jgi:small membrane protein
MIVPILLIGLALILAYIGSRKQLSRTQLLFVLLFFAIGVVSVLFQPLTMRAAAFLNVGRGADLLLYFSVLCGVLIAANFYFRFKETERILVEVVRKMAILSPRHPAGESSGD